MLKKDLKTKKVLEKRITELENEFLVTGIPVGHAVNSIVPGDTVMNMPNAQVIGNQNVPMVYLNGDAVPYGYASPGNDIKVLEIFEGMLLVLIPNGSGAEGDGQWSIGYLETSVLGSTVEINYNTIVWNDGSDKEIVDGNGDFLYTLPATQTIQFLYETPNNNYACILFNGDSGALQTGYVPMSEGTFYRYSYLRTGSLQAPGIANNSTSGASGSTGSTGSGCSLTEITAMYIGSFEGFQATPYTYGVGPDANSVGYGSHYTAQNFPSLPITKTQAFDYLLNLLSEKIPTWNNIIADELAMSGLNDCQLVSLYDFAYNEGDGWLPALTQKLATDETFANTFANWEVPAALSYRRNQEWQTYSEGEYFFGNAIDSLPEEYIAIANSLNN